MIWGSFFSQWRRSVGLILWPLATGFISAEKELINHKGRLSSSAWNNTYCHSVFFQFLLFLFVSWMTEICSRHFPAQCIISTLMIFSSCPKIDRYRLRLKCYKLLIEFASKHAQDSKRKQEESINSTWILSIGLKYVLNTLVYVLASVWTQVEN